MPHALTDFLASPAPWIMGVVNITPDSFSDGGHHLTPEAAVAQGLKLLADGADILDLGAESTAPGRQPIAPETEQTRLLPVVLALAAKGCLSIDTYRASTAARCLALGARIVNDVSALRADPDMARVVAEHRAVLVMMHAKDGPLPHATDAPRHYRDVVAEIGNFLEARVEVALAAGIPPERLVLDPGARQLKSKYPLAATLLLRAMITDTLEGAKSSRYKHAARHLRECRSLAASIPEHGAFETHETFARRLRAKHGRKSSFWKHVAD